MPVSKARIAANQRYNEKAYDQVTLRTRKAENFPALIDAAAAAAGKSKAAWLHDVIAAALIAQGITVPAPTVDEDPAEDPAED